MPFQAEHFRLMSSFSCRPFALVLPREIYNFGDQIEWEKLESYSIAAKVEDNLEKMASSLHDSFLAWVEKGSKKPIKPFRDDQFFILRMIKHLRCSEN